MLISLVIVSGLVITVACVSVVLFGYGQLVFVAFLCLLAYLLRVRASPWTFGSQWTSSSFVPFIAETLLSPFGLLWQFVCDKCTWVLFAAIILLHTVPVVLSLFILDVFFCFSKENVMFLFMGIDSPFGSV